MALRIQDVTYLVRDHDTAIAFFVDALGFELRQDQTFEGGWRRVVVGPDGGGTGLVLALTSDDSAVRRQADGEVAFFLKTDDFVPNIGAWSTVACTSARSRATSPMGPWPCSRTFTACPGTQSSQLTS